MQNGRRFPILRPVRSTVLRSIAVLWLLAAVPGLLAQVTVSIANQNVQRGATVDVPVAADGLWNELAARTDSLVAYQFAVTYNPAVVQAAGATKTGTMTAGWDDPQFGIRNAVAPATLDTLLVAAFSPNWPSGKRLVSDGGILVKVRMLVTGSTGANATLQISGVKLGSVKGTIPVGSMGSGVLTVTDNTPAKTVAIELTPNWNLVSFNISPDSPTIPGVFGAVPVVFMFGYTSGVGPKTWDVNRPSFLNDLANLDGLHGYWMKLNSQTNRTLSVTGIAVSVGTPMLMYKGWSLIGYLPDAKDTIPHSFLGLGSAYRFISAYAGGVTQTWDRARPAFLNDLKYLNAKQGYWVKMDTTKVLVYPSSGYKPGKAAVPAIAEHGGKIQSSSQWCDFWSFQPELLLPGDSVRVFDGAGVLCGDTVVAAERGFLVHVAGDDPSTTDVDEGATPGESIRFVVGGRGMNVAGTSLSFDSTLISGLAAAWENMGSKRVRLTPDTASGIGSKSPGSPRGFTLFQNHPNPFNAGTVIRFILPESRAAFLRVYDVNGRLVREWAFVEGSGGQREVAWDGRDGKGAEAASGIYLIRLDWGGGPLVRKCTLIR
jgi:hypothetical protein